MNRDKLVSTRAPVSSSSPAARTVLRVVLPGLILALVGCDNSSTGFCQHINEDPVLTITAATNSVTGDPIPTLRLRELSIAADEEYDEFFVMTEPPSYNIVRAGDDYMCQVSCGFGAAVGRYDFAVVAEGFQQRGLSITADYERFIPGCPSRSRGSTEVTVELDPVAG
jgi:hypothetical protein